MIFSGFLAMFSGFFLAIFCGFFGYFFLDFSVIFCGFFGYFFLDFFGNIIWIFLVLISGFLAGLPGPRFYGPDKKLYFFWGGGDPVVHPKGYERSDI